MRTFHFKFTRTLHLERIKIIFFSPPNRCQLFAYTQQPWHAVVVFGKLHGKNYAMRGIFGGGGWRRFIQTRLFGWIASSKSYFRRFFVLPERVSVRLAACEQCVCVRSCIHRAKIRLFLHIEPSTECEVGKWLKRVCLSQFRPLSPPTHSRTRQHTPRQLVRKPTATTKIVIIRRRSLLLSDATAHRLYWCQRANMKIIWLPLTEMRLGFFVIVARCWCCHL